MTEHALQIAVASYLTGLEKHVKAFVWCHCPNSIWTSKSQAGKHKAYGMRAGVPDCLIFGRNGTVVFIELKTHKGTLSDAQKLFHEKLNALGYPVHVVKSINTEGAVKQVEMILKGAGLI